MNAIIYCRGSGQREEASRKLAEQEARCRSLMASNGYNMIRLFRDVGSAHSVDRPGLASMLAFLSGSEEPVVVIIDDVHVLARSYAAHARLRAQIHSHDATIEWAADAGRNEEQRMVKVSLSWA